MSAKSKALTFGSACKMSVGGTVMFASGGGGEVNEEWSEPSEIGMIGTDKPANTGRQIVKTDVKLSPQLQLQPSDVAVLLPLFFDAGYVAADDPSAKNTCAVVVDFGVDVFTYAAMWLSELEISGRENEPLIWTPHLLGTSEANSGSVAPLVVPDRLRFSDCTFSIGGNTYYPTGFNFKFQYDLAERFHNSVTRSSISARIPRCLLDLDLDVNSDTWADLYALAGTDTAVGSTAGVVVAISDGAHGLTITIPETAVMNAKKVPDINGPEELKGTVNLRAWLKTAQSDIVTLAYA